MVLFGMVDTPFATIAYFCSSCSNTAHIALILSAIFIAHPLLSDERVVSCLLTH